jgi:hypothetical protein
VKTIYKATLIFFFSLFGGQLTLGQTQAKLRLVVFTQGGGISAGEFIFLEQDSIILLNGTTIVRVASNDATKIIVSSNRRSSSFALPGAIMGGYVGTLLIQGLGYGQDVPFAFSRSGEGSFWSVLLGTTPGVLVGGLIGYLASPSGDEKQEVYEMTDGRLRLRALDRIAGHRSAAENRNASWHLTMHGAWVPTPIIDKFTSDAQSRSYQSYGWNYNYRSSSTVLNLARRIQLTYSLAPTIEIGLAHMWLGEPSADASYYNYLPDGSFESRNITVRPRASGNFLVGKFNPHFFPSTSPVEVKLGGGVGFVAWECGVDGYFSSYGPNYSNPSSQNISKLESGSWMSGYLNAEATLRINDNFFVGVVADVLFTPATEIALPSQFLLPPQKMNANHSSIGFTMGMQF